jgi:hypothetical protein
VMDKKSNILLWTKLPTTNILRKCRSYFSLIAGYRFTGVSQLF